MTYTVSGIVLAAAAGLNAFIPLLGLALADRITDEIDLSRPYNVISSTGGIVILLTLLTIDLILDKLPKADHINDLINSAIRPAAGAFLVMAVTQDRGEVSVVVAMLLGLVVAGAVHAAKTLSRLRINQSTDGMLNPLISFMEDGISAMLALLAIALPWLGLGFLAVSGLGLAWVYRTVPNSKRMSTSADDPDEDPELHVPADAAVEAGSDSQIA